VERAEQPVLLDEDGRLLRVAPAAPYLLGQDLTRRYEHLRLALAGQVAVSRAVLSAARRRPVVAFAVPYETRYGRRVLSGAYEIAPALAASLARRPTGGYQSGAEDRYYASRAVERTRGGWSWPCPGPSWTSRSTALAAGSRGWCWSPSPWPRCWSWSSSASIWAAGPGGGGWRRSAVRGHHGPGPLQAVLRSTDLLARYGGEEFALLAPARPLEDVGFLADRLRSAVPGGATVSVGVAAWDGQERAEELVARADSALYAAKEGGRDRDVVA
jgi:Diguanylate cyclase, GGDEF domain